LQEAKAKFSEVVKLALSDGAQVVTRKEIPAVAIVPFAVWEKVEPRYKKPSLLDVLLSHPDSKTDDFEKYLPKRTRKGKKNPRVPQF
jgi:prevent-host-death family protein